MKGMLVFVKVNPGLRDFILFTNNGSDLLIPKKGDWMWLAIKQQLVTRSESSEVKQSDSYIRIKLLDSHGKSYVQSPKIVYDKSYNRIKPDYAHFIRINTSYRCYLSEKGHSVISRLLNRQFKFHFHTFMFAYLSANPKIEQKQAMLIYRDKFNISESKITEDMLMKSWNRSQEKVLLKKGALFTPLMY